MAEEAVLKLLKIGDDPAQEKYHINGMMLHLLAAEAHVVGLKLHGNPALFTKFPKKEINMAARHMTKVIDHLSNFQTEDHQDFALDTVSNMTNVLDLLMYCNNETISEVVELLKSKLFDDEQSDD